MPFPHSNTRPDRFVQKRRTFPPLPSGILYPPYSGLLLLRLARLISFDIIPRLAGATNAIVLKGFFFFLAALPSHCTCSVLCTRYYVTHKYDNSGAALSTLRPSLGSEYTLPSLECLPCSTGSQVKYPSPPMRIQAFV